MDREARQATYSSWGHNELDMLVTKEQHHHKLNGLLQTFQINKNEASETYCLVNIFLPKKDQKFELSLI